MNIDEFTYNGSVYKNVPVDGLVGLGLSEREISNLVLIQYKQDVQKQLLSLHATALKRMTGGATLEESLTWTPKETAAKAYILGNASSAERGMIEAEAALTGENTIELAQLITRQKNSTYPIIGKLSGMRRIARETIKTAETLEEAKAAFLVFTTGLAELSLAE